LPLSVKYTAIFSFSENAGFDADSFGRRNTMVGIIIRITANTAIICIRSFIWFVLSFLGYYIIFMQWSKYSYRANFCTANF
jgi:hypothetical protein